VVFSGLFFGYKFVVENKQPNSATVAQNSVDKTLKTLDFRWDFQTVILVTLALIFLSLYVEQLFETHLLDLVGGSDAEVKHFGCKYLIDQFVYKHSVLKTCPVVLDELVRVVF